MRREAEAKAKAREARIQKLSFGTQPECRKVLRADLDNRLWQERGNNSAKPTKAGNTPPKALTAWGKGKDAVTYKNLMTGRL